MYISQDIKLKCFFRFHFLINNQSPHYSCSSQYPAHKKPVDYRVCAGLFCKHVHVSHVYTYVASVKNIQ